MCKAFLRRCLPHTSSQRRIGIGVQVLKDSLKASAKAMLTAMLKAILKASLGEVILKLC